MLFRSLGRAGAVVAVASTTERIHERASELGAEGVDAAGFVEPRPIQAQTIPAVLEGRDVLGLAQTGTGKTAAFSIPMVEGIPAGHRKPAAIVLAPTRELARQVAAECAELAKYKDLRIAVIYGGVGFGEQEQALKDGAEIIVGTPGRILDHIRRGNLDLSETIYATLDETFDRESGVFSLVSVFGIKRALSISALLHLSAFIVLVVLYLYKFDTV